jgi:hypothetical protein
MASKDKHPSRDKEEIATHTKIAIVDPEGHFGFRKQALKL